MKKIEVELYTPQSNYAVLRLPERNSPGVVFQGDSLHNIISDLGEALAFSKKYNDEDLNETLKAIIDSLQKIKYSYELTLEKEGISLPYHK